MTLHYHLNQPAAVVFDCLTDMQKFASVHPVIYRVEEKSASNYLVYERLKMLFIPVSFTYPVKVESDILTQAPSVSKGLPAARQDSFTGKIRMDSLVKGMAKIEIHFSIREENGNTTVEETLVFSSRLPIKKMFQRLFKKQHAKLFRNIENFGKTN
jgi:carbon monoxide dehydrogenase subunit G